MGAEFPNKDLMNDLASRLGVGGSIEDAKALFFEAVEKLSTDPRRAQELFEESRERFKQLSQKYEEQKQFRTASEANFFIALTYHYENNVDLRNQVFEEVSEQLLKTGDYYYSQGEALKAVAPYFLSILLKVILGKIEDATQLYHTYLPKYEGDPSLHQGTEALYGVGHLIQAINEIRQENFLQAQDLFGSHLKPLLKNARLDGFGGILLDMALQYGQEKIRANTKLPKIEVVVRPPVDPQFNIPFPIEVIVKNTGEGACKNFTMNLMIPSELEVLEGTSQLSVPEIPANGEAVLKLVARYQEAIKQEAEINIPGEYTYEDMLATKHSQPISPITFLVRATSLRKELESAINSLLEYWSNLRGKEWLLEDEVRSQVLESIQELVNTVQEKFKDDELELTQYLIGQVKKLINSLEASLVNPNIIMQVKERHEQELKQALQQKEEEVRTTLEQAHAEEISKLKQEHATELDELKKTHATELEELKARHEKEKEDLQAKFQVQLERALKSLEEELTTRHQQELQKLRDSSEEVINELRSEIEKVREETARKVEEETSKKKDKEIEDIKNTYEEEIRRLREGFEEKEKALVSKVEAQMRAKFEEEKEGIIRSLTEEHEQRITELQEAMKNKAAQEYNMKLEEIKQQYEQQIEEYKSQIKALQEEIQQLKRT